MAIELTEAQRTTVKQWVAEGCGLSEIQKRLSSEFKLSPTFMEVRLLVLDLGVDVKDKAAPPAPADLKKAGVAAADEGPEEWEEPAAAGGASSVSVQVDRIMKPGSLVSGTVKFSDGMSGTWMLDQYGRLALSTGKKGYQPSPADVQAFQQELRHALETRGF